MMKHFDESWVEPAVARINKSSVQHYSYHITKSRLFSKTLVHRTTDCYALVGPSRVGKTSIAREFESTLNPICSKELMKSRPVVRLTCRNRGDRGAFTTKGFLLDALAAIDHPFYTIEGNKLNVNHENLRRQDRETVTTLQAVFENALIVLGTKYLIIDETQHLQYMVGGKKSTLHMLEFFKSLAEKLDITLLFVGAYPIVNVLQLSPHMLGRLSTIEMRRYTVESDDSLAQFHELLHWFSTGIKFEKGVSSLCDWNRELFDGSLGVIGLLSSWIRDAFSEMIAQGDTNLSLEHLMYTRKPQLFLDEMAREINDGELYLRLGKIPENRRKKKKGAAKRTGNTKPFRSKVKRRQKGERA